MHAGAEQMDSGKQTGGPVPALIPPHLVRHDFLDDAAASGLLDYARTHEALFTPTETLTGVESHYRVSLGTRDMGPFKPMLREKLRALVPSLVAALRVTPFDPTRIELQFVAHGDGAFFIRHTDMEPRDETGQARVLSGVFYLHTRPKAFNGGALRLHSFDPKGGFVDIEPVHNSLVVFPAWAPHEVRPVGVASRRFMDSRFAVNCWFYARL